MSVRALAAAATLALAGCAGGATVVTQVERPRATGLEPLPVIGGAVPVVIRGNPPDGAAPAAAAAAMRLPAFVPGPSAFVAVPPGRLRDRFELSFSPVSAQALCAGRAGGGPSAQPLTVTIALCRGARVEASAQLRDATLAGPSDAAFGAAMSRALSDMLRPEKMRTKR